MDVPSSLRVYVYCEEGRNELHFVYLLTSVSEVTEMHNPFPPPLFAVHDVNVRDENDSRVEAILLPASMYIPPPHPSDAEHEVNVREEREV